MKAKAGITQKASETKEAKFTKEQLAASKRFAGDRDLVNALLGEGEYTISEVEKTMKQYRKGEVK